MGARSPASPHSSGPLQNLYRRSPIPSNSLPPDGQNHRLSSTRQGEARVMTRSSKSNWRRPTAVVAVSAFAVGALASIAAAVSSSGPSAAASQYANKVTICHHTHSQKNPFVTITVSQNALPAHMRHRDTTGPCPPVSATSAAASRGKSGQHVKKSKKAKVRSEISGARGKHATAPRQAESSPGRSGSTPGASVTSPGRSGSAPGHSTSPPSRTETPSADRSSPASSSDTAPGRSGTAPGHNGTSPGHSGTAPGQSGTAPGQSGTPPGQSGSAPGQSGSTPGQGGTPPGQGKKN
jgi:hypothetical protein